jgi:hypothetical protein
MTSLSSDPFDPTPMDLQSDSTRVYISFKLAPLSLASRSRDPYPNLGGMITLPNLKVISHTLSACV